MKKIILIVDDEKNTRDGLRHALEDQYEVAVAGDIAGAKAIMETEHADLLLTDLRLGGENGMDLMSWAQRQQHPPVCIIMTAYGGIEDAVEAMKHGAYDFVTKPVNIDRLDLLVKRSLHGSEIERENTRLREQIDKKFGLEGFVGDSPAIERVLVDPATRDVALMRAQFERMDDGRLSLVTLTANALWMQHGEEGVRVLPLRLLETDLRRARARAVGEALGPAVRVRE